MARSSCIRGNEEAYADSCGDQILVEGVLDVEEIHNLLDVFLDFTDHSGANANLHDVIA